MSDSVKLCPAITTGARPVAASSPPHALVAARSTTTTASAHLRASSMAGPFLSTSDRRP